MQMLYINDIVNCIKDENCKLVMYADDTNMFVIDISRDAAIQKANEYAIEVPMETAEKCFRVLQLSEKLVDNGNPNSVSDAGVAAEVALAGIRGAGMNVMINLSGLEDLSHVEDIKNKIYKLINDAEVIHKTIYSKTLLIIKS